MGEKWRAGGGGEFSFELSLSSVSQNLKFFGWGLVNEVILQPVEIENALKIMQHISKLDFVV
jgi:hypothetical protein|tara:strand:+ start:169 stop:354 length:186 start_codon:yes stop_codon:yes gene_type:complete